MLPARQRRARRNDERTVCASTGSGQKSGDPVPIDIEQGQLCPGLQRLCAQEQSAAQRIISERDDVLTEPVMTSGGSKNSRRTIGSEDVGSKIRNQRRRDNRWAPGLCLPPQVDERPASG